MSSGLCVVSSKRGCDATLLSEECDAKDDADRKVLDLALSGTMIKES